MRRPLWLVALVGVLCLACSNDRTIDPAGPSVEKIPDITYKESGAVTWFYDATNDFARATLERATVDPIVRLDMERFAAQGYAYHPEHSFVTEGLSADGKFLEITVLSLGSTTAPDQDAVYLFYIRGTDRSVVVPMHLTSDDIAASSGYTPLGEGVWYDIVDPLNDPAATGPRAAFGWSWRRWGRCLGSAIAGGARRVLRRLSDIPDGLLALHGILHGRSGPRWIALVYLRGAVSDMKGWFGVLIVYPTFIAVVLAAIHRLVRGWQHADVLSWVLYNSAMTAIWFPFVALPYMRRRWPRS